MGQITERFEFREQIGVGATGSVWRAYDRQREAEIALKVLTGSDSLTMLRYVQEQGLRIHHPHVVTPDGWLAEDAQVVLTMPLVRGGSLAQLRREHGPLPHAYVRVVIDQILQALDFVHARGIVHRDIKPANVLLEDTGAARPHARLTDFGIAAAPGVPRLTQVPGNLGTDGYVPPEGLSAATPAADLYAVGVVAREMLGAVPAALQPLIGSLTDHRLGSRPPSAKAAISYLRELGVPAGSPWVS